MDGKPKIISNTLFQIAGRFFVIITSLLITGFLTRLLGVEIYGDYVFITSIVILVSGLSDFGASTIGVREASLKKQEAKEIFSHILSFRLIVTVLFLGFYLLLVMLMPQFKGIKAASIIASFVIPLLVLKTISQAVFQVNFRLDYSSLLEVVSSFIFLLLMAAFFFWRSAISLTAIMLFWTMSALATGLLGFFLLRNFLRLRIIFSKEKLKEVFWQSLPLGTYLLVYSLYDRGVDSFFLKTFNGNAAVGYYGLAYKIYGNLILGAAFLMNSLFPLISSLKNDQEKLNGYFKKTFSFLLIAAAIIFVIFFFSSSLIIKIITGNGFNISAGILRVLLLAIFFSYINHLTGYLLVCLNEQSKMLKFSLLAFAFNIVANIIFIPIFSFWAAAVITVITEFIIFILSVKYLKNKYGFILGINSIRENIIGMVKLKGKFFN